MCKAGGGVVAWITLSRPPFHPRLLQAVYTTEGWRALYGGMGTHLLRSVPNAAVVFLAYEVAVRTYADHWIPPPVADLMQESEDTA